MNPTQPPAHDDLRARLPELPEATELNKALRFYTAEQMRDYAIAALSALPEAGDAFDPARIGWVFQHEETGLTVFCPDNGVNTAESFAAANPRYLLYSPAYSAPQPAPAADSLCMKCCAEAYGLSTTPAAVSQPAAMVEGLVEKWREFSESVENQGDGIAANYIRDCADELESLLSAGAVQGGEK